MNSYNRSSVRQHIEGEGSQIRDKVIPSILSDVSDRHDLRVNQSLLQGWLYVFTHLVFLATQAALYLFFYIYSLVSFVAFIRVLGTCYGKETSRFCQAQNFEASFFCTAHFITSACSFNIGLALLLGIRSLDPRSRARTTPALTWCWRQLWSQTSCSAMSRSQYRPLTFSDKHWNVWWNLAS